MAKLKKAKIFALLVGGFMIVFLAAVPAYAADARCGGTKGDLNSGVKVGFKIGCNHNFENAALDATFALLRFITVGVGIAAVASIIVAGIQYTTSQGNPQKAAAALKRVTSAVLGLVIYFFIFAIIQWLVPGGLF